MLIVQQASSSCLYDVMITMWVSSDISKYECQGSVLLIGFLHI